MAAAVAIVCAFCKKNLQEREAYENSANYWKREADRLHEEQRRLAREVAALRGKLDKMRGILNG